MAAGPSRRRRSKKAALVAHLSLVSLMDLFTIILLFLLQTFSSSAETFTTSDKFKLPLSTATAELRPRLTLQVTQADIMIDGIAVVTLKDVTSNNELLIPALYKALEKEAEKSVYIAGINKEVELTREVVLLGDRKIPFLALEKIMYTCGQVGYNNIRLAVISVGK